MLAPLKISTQMRISSWNRAPWSTEEDERVFKLTVCTNPARKSLTFGNLKDTQAVFDRLAKAHEDPMTAKTIFLCPYHTFTRRFSTDEGEAVGAQRDFACVPKTPIDDGQKDLAPEDLELQKELDDEEAVPLSKLALKGVQLYRLILDEAHAVKNVQSTMNRLLQQLDYDAIMLASATILSNHVRDFYGYIELIWDKDLPFDWDPSTSVKADTWYDIGTWKRLTQGKDAPEIESGRIYRDTEDERTDGPPKTIRQLERYRHYSDHIRATGEPLFLMNPKQFFGFSSASQHSPAFAQSAIRTILHMLCVRRSMLSVMTLPDGTKSWPGKGIPPLHCNEVEFDLPAIPRAKLHQAIRNLHTNLTTMGPRKKTFKSSHGARVEKPKVQLNGNALRRMCLASTNVHNLKMTSPIVRTTKLLKDVTLRKIMIHTIKESTQPPIHNKKKQPLLLPSVDDQSEALTPQKEKRREALQRRQRPEAAADTAEMNRVAVEDPTKGLQWAFFLTRDSMKESFPESAIGRRIIQLERAVNEAQHTIIALNNNAKKTEKETTKKNQQIADLKKKIFVLENKVATIEKFFGSIVLPKATVDTTTTESQETSKDKGEDSGENGEENGGENGSDHGGNNGSENGGDTDMN
ncbi:hypothetical protein NW768_005074 [Fusarium equiseti]|uniref:SNF2 N-terminal domain-containing protein n=1 Tax=Fusarium equiseti TaxID=61235 RepID=A0ABQ8RE90_FUSEQ|nr:hypothetical protein NW768_005074 [Fusarium equiseti]